MTSSTTTTMAMKTPQAYGQTTPIYNSSTKQPPPSRGGGLFHIHTTHPSLDDINEILTMGKAVLKLLQRKSADFEYSYDYNERVLINDLRNFEANGGGEMLDALLAGVPPEDIIPTPRK